MLLLLRLHQDRAPGVSSGACGNSHLQGVPEHSAGGGKYNTRRLQPPCWPAKYISVDVLYMDELLAILFRNVLLFFLWGRPERQAGEQLTDRHCKLTVYALGMCVNVTSVGSHFRPTQVPGPWYETETEPHQK
jgi:hypothetical protein